MMQDHVRVFVSHSHKDLDFTMRLVRDLRAAGADVWVDVENITYNDFLKHISDGLTGSHYLILVQTPDALHSPWVIHEVNVAINMMMQGRMRAFIPFIAKPCDPAEIPTFWSTFQACDATRGYESALARLLHVLGLDGQRRPVESGSRSLPPLPPGPRGTQVTGRTTVFRDHRTALEAAIELLEALPPLHGEEAPAIKLTVQGDTLFKVLGRALHERWSQARIGALKYGWHIRPYWRLDDHLFRTVRWVIDMFVVLQMGKYEPYYFRTEPDAYDGLLRAPYELLLIPAYQDKPARAMVFFATHNEHHVDTAILTEDQAFYGLLHAHLDELTKPPSTHPLFDTYWAGRARFLAEMEQREHLGAGRLLVKPDLAVLTIPLSFYQGETPWTQRAREMGWQEGQLFALQQKRLRTLQSASRQAVYRDICSKRALQQWVKTGTYSAYQSVASELTVEPIWIKRHLDNAIRMLRQHKNYEIALSDEEHITPTPPFHVEGAVLTDPLWMVAGRPGEEAVFMEILNQDVGELRNAINLRFDEARVVKAFRSYFETLWTTHASPRAQNKAKVIGVLQEMSDSITA